MNLWERAKTIAHGAKALAMWLGDGAETVQYLQAQGRANRCLQCPVMIPCPKLEGVAADAVRQMVETKNKLSLRVSGEKALGCCGACSCVLRLKTWLPIEKIQSETNDEGMEMNVENIKPMPDVVVMPSHGCERGFVQRFVNPVAINLALSQEIGYHGNESTIAVLFGHGELIYRSLN
jgi:hypothetical protein